MRLLRGGASILLALAALVLFEISRKDDYAARRLYSQAVVRELTAPGGGDPLAYELMLDRP